MAQGSQGLGLQSTSHSSAATIPSIPGSTHCIPRPVPRSRSPETAALLAVLQSTLPSHTPPPLPAAAAPPPIPPFNLAMTRSRWARFFRCTSKFCTVISGPAVYDLPGQSRQRMRGSQANWMLAGIGSPGCRDRGRGTNELVSVLMAQ